MFHIHLQPPAVLAKGPPGFVPSRPGPMVSQCQPQGSGSLALAYALSWHLPMTFYLECFHWAPKVTRLEALCLVTQKQEGLRWESKG